MVRLAIAAYPEFQDSDLEIRRGGVSYTIDTIRELRQTLGSEVEIWLLMGQDSYRDVSTWKEPDSIAAECFFGVARRPGYGGCVETPVGGIRSKFVEITAVDISSTDVRARLGEGKTVRFLVPWKVEDYIRKHAVYAKGPAG
jgi:nicotinate-nucleotide adenylyltransferase